MLSLRIWTFITLYVIYSSVFTRLDISTCIVILFRNINMFSDDKTITVEEDATSEAESFYERPQISTMTDSHWHDCRLKDSEMNLANIVNPKSSMTSELKNSTIYF